MGRYDLDTGAVTDAIGYPSSTQLGLLLGPYPVVFTFPSGGHVHLDRVG